MVAGSELLLNGFCTAMSSFSLFGSPGSMGSGERDVLETPGSLRCLLRVADVISAKTDESRFRSAGQGVCSFPALNRRLRIPLAADRHAGCRVIRLSVADDRKDWNGTGGLCRKCVWPFVSKLSKLRVIKPCAETGVPGSTPIRSSGFVSRARGSGTIFETSRILTEKSKTEGLLCRSTSCAFPNAQREQNDVTVKCFGAGLK